MYENWPANLGVVGGAFTAVALCVLLHYEGNLELDLDRAPVELRSFFERIQLSAQQSMNADFGGFRP